MALTPERITELSDRLLRVVGAGYVRPQDADGFARAIESEVRRQDEALIRQMLEALEQSHATLWEEDDDPERPAHAAIAAARARLEGKKP